MDGLLTSTACIITAMTCRMCDTVVFSSIWRAVVTGELALGIAKLALGIDMRALVIDKRDKLALGTDKLALGTDKPALGIDKPHNHV